MALRKYWVEWESIFNSQGQMQTSRLHHKAFQIFLASISSSSSCAQAKRIPSWPWCLSTTDVNRQAGIHSTDVPECFLSRHRGISCQSCPYVPPCMQTCSSRKHARLAGVWTVYSRSPEEEPYPCFGRTCSFSQKAVWIEVLVPILWALIAPSPDTAPPLHCRALFWFPEHCGKPRACPWVMGPFWWDRQGHTWAVALTLIPYTALC